MGLKDRDVAKALDTLTSEFESMEALVETLNETIADLEEQNENYVEEISDLEDTIEEKNQCIKELEEALAEAYLTSENEDGQATTNIVSTGCLSDVSSSTDDETANG